MPDERVIQEIENILSDVVDLGGQGERTSIVPNMLVRDASPTNLVDYIIIADNRDNDNILALRVPGVVYADNDLVNVIFPQGGEAIAFQQGSGSTTSGLWDIVTGTDDIYYNKGDVGIGKSVAPDAALEILSTSQQQLRLTFQEDTKYANFTVDTNHDLTVKPSSTGQIIFQPTTDSTDFLQVLDADGGTPILNVDSTNERVGIGTNSPETLFQAKASSGTSGQGRFTNFQGEDLDFVIYDSADVGSIFGISPRGGIGTVNTNTGPLVIGTNHASDLSLGTNSLVRMTIDSGGDVGIGTATPDSTLHLESTVTDLRLEVDATTGIPQISFYDPSGLGALFQWRGTTAVPANFFRFGTNKAGGEMGFMANSLDEAMRIDSSLNVGIGITTPGSRLHIADATGGEQLRFSRGTGIVRIVQANNADDLFLYNNDASILVMMWDGSTGNVGLSTSTPSTRLDIGAGAMEFEEMTAPAAGAANTTRTYAEDNAGTTRQRVKFSSGNAVTIAEDGGLQTYTPSNVVTDRSYDADATSVAELADVLGTLIADFQAAGVLG